MSNKQWWRYRASEFVVAICFVAATLYLIDNATQRMRAAVAPGAWLAVNDIHVPDFFENEDPSVIFDRIVREPFQAFWTVEVQQQDMLNNFTLTCTASGARAFEPGVPVPTRFVSDLCGKLKPGYYRIRVTWMMRKPGWPEKTVVAYSNVFRVRARN